MTPYLHILTTSIPIGASHPIHRITAPDGGFLGMVRHHDVLGWVFCCQGAMLTEGQLGEIAGFVAAQKRETS